MPAPGGRRAPGQARDREGPATDLPRGLLGFLLLALAFVGFGLRLVDGCGRVPRGPLPSSNPHPRQKKIAGMKTARYVHFDVLRAVAMVRVVVFHAIGYGVGLDRAELGVQMLDPPSFRL
ncbi:hypothetical protein [Streptomyces sp. NPDC001480]|uniref:hypothetical protein n=1 Tax=Streptomyces sp. NPDC001480 TaxID=3364577 RepID=UPI003693A702